MKGLVEKWMGLLALPAAALPVAEADELTLAIRLEDEARVEQVLEGEGGSTKPDGDGLTALFYAAVAGRGDWVEQLLESGFDPDEPGQQIAPLWAAAVRGDVETARLLLDAGAGPDGGLSVADDAGPQPFFLGADGVNLNRKPVPRSRLHPVSAAVRSGSVEVLKLLWEREPDLNPDRIFGFADDPSSSHAWEELPIPTAMRLNQPEMARLLIRRGGLQVPPKRERSFRPDSTLVSAFSMSPVSDGLMEAILATGADPVLPDGRRANTWAIGTRWRIRPWDGLTAAARAGEAEWVWRFLGGRDRLPAHYLVCLRHLAHVGGDAATIRAVETVTGAGVAKVPKPTSSVSPQAENGPASLSGQPEAGRFFLPRIGEAPEQPTSPDELTVAVLSGPGAAGEADALAAELSSVDGWVLVERAEILALLRERELAGLWSDGAYDLSSVGDRLRADLLLLVEKIGGGEDAVLSVEVVDVRTGLTLGRSHVLAAEFDPAELTARISGDVVAARERFAAVGGRVSAVTVLGVGSQRGMEGGPPLARLVKTGLVAMIDATPGAVAMTRRQMRPLIEEKNLAGEDSMWRAAWSVNGGVEAAGDGRIRLVLRATHLEDGRRADHGAEGTPDDMRALVSECWSGLVEKTELGEIGEAAPALAANREAGGLLREARWLLAVGRAREARELVETAVLLKAEPSAAVPTHLDAARRSLPWILEDGRFVETGSVPAGDFGDAALGHPALGLKLAARLPEYADFLALLEDSLNRHRDLFLGPARRTGVSANELAWDGWHRLIHFRTRLPDYLLQGEIEDALKGFDADLVRVCRKLIALMPEVPGESAAVAPWMGEIDFRRFPDLRDPFADWFVRLLNEGDKLRGPDRLSSRRAAVSAVGDVAKAAASPRLIAAMLERLDRLGADASAVVPALRAELECLIASGGRRAKTARRVFAERARFAADPDLGRASLLEASFLGNWMPVFDRQVHLDLPSGGEALCPELVERPRPVAEWARQSGVYRHWGRMRERAADDPEKIAASLAARKTDAGVTPANPVSYASRYDELLKNSYPDSEGNASALDLALRILDLPAKQGREIAASGTGLSVAADRKGVGPDGLIPEIRFHDPLDGGIPVIVADSGAPAAMMAGDAVLAPDGKVWFSGVTSAPRIWRDLENLPNRAASGVMALAVVDLAADGRSRIHTPDPPRRGFSPQSQLSLEPSMVFCVPFSGAVFGVAGDGDLLDWGVGVTPSRMALRRGNRGAMASAAGRVFLLSERVLPEPPHQSVFRIYSLQPGSDPKILGESGRTPPRSPFDDPQDIPDRVVAVDGNVRVFANTEYVNRKRGPKAATYDIAAGQWIRKSSGDAAVRESRQADRLKRDNREQTIDLPGGHTAVFPRFHAPGVLSARAADGGERRHVPVTLGPPDDFPIRFRHRIRPGEEEAEMILTAAELARTAYARPVVLGAEGGSLIVALANGEAIYPMVWQLPLRDLETRLFGSESPH
jgi:hypothetical protein